MLNINLLHTIRTIFGSVTKAANVVDQNLNSISNLSKLGENYTANLVAEQEILNAKRLKDLEAKASKKYEEEKEAWNI